MVLWCGCVLMWRGGFDLVVVGGGEMVWILYKWIQLQCALVFWCESIGENWGGMVFVFVVGG